MPVIPSPPYWHLDAENCDALLLCFAVFVVCCLDWIFPVIANLEVWLAYVFAILIQGVQFECAAFGVEVSNSLLAKLHTFGQAPSFNIIQSGTSLTITHAEGVWCYIRFFYLFCAPAENHHSFLKNVRSICGGPDKIQITVRLAPLEGPTLGGQWLSKNGPKYLPMWNMTPDSYIGVARFWLRWMWLSAAVATRAQKNWMIDDDCIIAQIRGWTSAARLVHRFVTVQVVRNTCWRQNSQKKKLGFPTSTRIWNHLPGPATAR